jgi:hypothetical protein
LLSKPENNKEQHLSSSVGLLFREGNSSSSNNNNKTTKSNFLSSS